MPKAVQHCTRSPKQNPDAELLAACQRHGALWQQWGEDAPPELIHEACELELKIVATPVFTPKGLAAKRRVVRRAEFNDNDGIIATILQLDVQRVGAGKTCRASKPQATASVIA